MSNFNEERLGKIVQLAKRGAKGERDNARDILRRLCYKYNLDYDALMSDTEKLQEFRIKPKRTHRVLALHILVKYAFPDAVARDVYRNRWSGELIFTTTTEKYFEALNAFEVLAPLFDKEIAKVRKAVFFGFMEKHHLYWKTRDGEEEKKNRTMTKEEWEARKRGSMLAEDMEDAELRKRIGTGI